LWGKSPARKVFPDAANVQLDAVLLFDQLTYRCPAPKKEIHLHLLRTLINDGAANRVFL
jgi:hypothetical protein